MELLIKSIQPALILGALIAMNRKIDLLQNQLLLQGNYNDNVSRIGLNYNIRHNSIVDDPCENGITHTNCLEFILDSIDSIREQIADSKLDYRKGSEGRQPGSNNATAVTTLTVTNVLDIKLKQLINCMATPNSADDYNIKFTACNVYVQSGMGFTAAAMNGKGNLIIGYDEADDASLDDDDYKTGSHNLVVGDGHTYSSYGGMVVGRNNKIMAPFATVSGGWQNEAFGDMTSISGGHSNKASESYTSILGGSYNVANGQGSSVSGGSNNHASGMSSSVLGGSQNEASGNQAVVAGGYYNVASGQMSSVAGGYYHKAALTGGSGSGRYNDAKSDYYGSPSSPGGGDYTTHDD